MEEVKNTKPSLDELHDTLGRSGSTAVVATIVKGLNGTFSEFSERVRSSVEEHARRKGYTQTDADGPNQMLEVTKLLGISKQHGVAEIVYKCAEFLKTPRRVLLEKVAGWAYILWRETKDE